jgi:two-component system phosphate regulon response regulator PhoB
MSSGVADGPFTVLIVDDERDLRALVEFNLRQKGWRTLEAASGAEALERARRDQPDLILLDVNLPDLPGTEVCRRLKADPQTRGSAVLFLTARSTEVDRIAGLELGADDYVVKPFSVRELVLRVDALRRRTVARGEEEAGPHKTLSAGPITLDLDAHVARVGGREVQLALLEFRLLAFLVEGAGRVRSREEILEKIWGYHSESESRTVDTHVKRLRDKLGQAGDRIETVRGIGYRIRSDGSEG